MRLEIGFSRELLVAPLILAAHVTPSWIKHVWTSTLESGMIVTTDFTNIPPQRHGDIEIMRLFVKTGWKQPVLQMLNQCRMYLQVFLISDIVTGVGSSIASQFWDRLHLAGSKFGWPSTIRPPPQSWILWRKALTTSLHLGCNQRLAVPLSKWFPQANPSSWYYHRPTNSIWECNNTQQPRKYSSKNTSTLLSQPWRD